MTPLSNAPRTAAQNETTNDARGELERLAPQTTDRRVCDGCGKEKIHYGEDTRHARLNLSPDSGGVALGEAPIVCFDLGEECTTEVDDLVDHAAAPQLVEEDKRGVYKTKPAVAVADTCGFCGSELIGDRYILSLHFDPESRGVGIVLGEACATTIYDFAAGLGGGSS